MSSINMNGDSVPPFYIAHHDHERDYPITDTHLQQADNQQYDLLTAPITTSTFRSRVASVFSASVASKEPPDTNLVSIDTLTSKDRDHPDTFLKPDKTLSRLLLTTSSWVDLTSPDPLVAELSRQVLSLEIQYASFCGAYQILIPGPKNDRSGHDGLSQYARAIKQALTQAMGAHLYITLPMTVQSRVDSDSSGYGFNSRPQYLPDTTALDDQTHDPLRSWDAWHFIRSICSYSTRLHVALIVPQTLPPLSVQSRWFSESVRILELPATTFGASSAGRLTLTSSHQQLIFRFARKMPTPWLLLSGIGSLTAARATPGVTVNDPTPAQSLQQPGSSQKRHKPFSHIEYLRRLQEQQTPRDAIDSFAAGYQDHLQSPLQPLADNLESLTYEVFESDPIKYEWYERAVASALKDWKRQGKPCSGRNGSVCVAVVGAGRGPIVTRVLQASTSSGVEVDVWAVEKNHNAFVLLQRYYHEKWNERVNLARSDMRSWSGPYHDAKQSTTGPEQRVYNTVDILVSELLGSFADNELSPECLDGVQHLMTPTHGISIPKSYTAHVTPIAAPKLHTDISIRESTGDSGASQIPYVVLLHATDYLSTHLPPRHPDKVKNPAGATPRPDPVPIIKQVWEFSHPNAAVSGPMQSHPSIQSNEHNRRFSKLEFRCRDRGVCHGLGGYFETVLCKPAPGDIASDAVELSTNPLTMDAKSKDMISWFPIYFPLKTPLYFPDSSSLVVSMWRQTDGRKVWYEWLVESFLIQVSAPQRRIRLGGSELHSSFNSGCLM